MASDPHLTKIADALVELAHAIDDAVAVLRYSDTSTAPPPPIDLDGGESAPAPLASVDPAPMASNVPTATRSDVPSAGSVATDSPPLDAPMNTQSVPIVEQPPTIADTGSIASVAPADSGAGEQTPPFPARDPGQESVQWTPPSGADFVKAAQAYAGVPYQAGGGHGANPHPLTGLDAAGLVRMALWDASGADPGDGDCESYRARWPTVDASAAQLGDVLYFGLHGTGNGVADHCAIAVGDGACIQSPEPATSVSQGPINLALQSTLISANRPWQ